MDKTMQRIFGSWSRPAMPRWLPAMLLILAVTGCRKDFQFDKVKDLSWNPDMAIALVNDTISFRKILTQGGADKHLLIDESGDVSILYYYNDNAFRIRPADLIRLTPVPFSYTHTITPAEQAIVAVSDLTLQPVPVAFNLSGSAADLRVDQLTVKRGQIRVTTNHTFSNGGQLTVSILHATRNGNPFSFTIEPVVSGPAESTVDLAGVKFDLTADPNRVTAEVAGMLRQTTQNLTGQQLSATFEIRIDTVAEFRGYLGKHTFAGLQDTVTVNVFNNAYTLGEVFFMDPQATITVHNSIGVPADFTIEKMVAINTVSARTLDIAGRLGAMALFSVPSPLPPPAPGIIKRVEYNNTNTGNAMYDFFDVKPDHIAFQVTNTVNPAGPAQNFFTDTSSLYADLRVKLPLWGHFDHLTYQDTFDFNINRPEEIERLEFRTRLVNGMPVTGQMQIYFCDAGYKRIDSLAGDDPILIREAPVDLTTGLPYPGMYGIRDTAYILDMNRMKRLETVKKAIVRAVLESPDHGAVNVRIRATQLINLEFSARARLRKEIDL